MHDRCSTTGSTCVCTGRYLDTEERVALERMQASAAAACDDWVAMNAPPPDERSRVTSWLRASSARLRSTAGPSCPYCELKQLMRQGRTLMEGRLAGAPHLNAGASGNTSFSRRCVCGRTEAPAKSTARASARRCSSEQCGWQKVMFRQAMCESRCSDASR